MTIPIIVLLIVSAIVAIIIAMYNKLIKNKNRMQEAWSGIDVYTKKRYDLIPNLVDTVKGYAAHESGTLENVTNLRSTAMQSNVAHDRIDAEMKLSKALTNVFALAENYPALRANENFQQLQEQLSELEDEISSARRYYNGTVRENNIAIESFPSNLVATMFGFTRGEFYNIEEAERSVPKVSF